MYSVPLDEDKRRQILDAALALADEQGLSAVTMRAVAARVGLTPMALYPHVGGKDGLLDGLVGRLLAEMLAAAHSPGGPVERLLAIGRAARALAKAHPSAYVLLLSRPSVTPDAVAAVDAMYQCLLDLGVPRVEVPRVERLLSTFGLGYASSEVNGRFGPANGSVRASRGDATPHDPRHAPAHHALVDVLAVPVDWDGEYEADLQDLLFLIRSRWRTRA